jgi:ribosome-interacting GTPase 1
MSITQKNKATSSHLGSLKAKLAKLRRELITAATSGSGGGKQEGFEVQKTGHARCGYVRCLLACLSSHASLFFAGCLSVQLSR